MTRRLLLAALFVALAVPALAQKVPTPRGGWGPSWIGGQPPGGNTRPEKLETDLTAVQVGKSAPPIGVQVHLWGDVAALKAGGKYELRYQIRPHTRKGEAGPTLGNAAHPAGVAFPIDSRTADDTWIGLEASVDVTRKDLSEATGMPRPPKDRQSHTVFLRVEPHLFDATAGKYLTPTKTTAAVLAAEVSAGGKVYEVMTLGEWVAMNRWNTVDEALARVADLDDFDPTASELEAGILKVLGMEDVKADVKGKFIAAVPAGRVYRKANFYLLQTLKQLADGTDETLKAAAKKKLEEAK
jgi:hypothetical protein